MNPYLIIAALVSVFAAGAGGFRLGVDHQKAGQIDKAETVAAAVEAANQSTAQAIAAIKPKYTTIQSKVQHEIKTNTVYADCKLTAGGLQLANQALDPSGAFTIGSGKLPKIDATER